MHFTRMGGYGTGEIPIIVRGDGCYLEDSNGKRYLDALAGLFSVNIGYGFGEEIGQAALEQMRELPFYTNWSYAHPARDRARGRAGGARAGRPQPRLLRLRRLRGGRVGLEARAPVLPARARQCGLAGETRHERVAAAAAQVQGDRTPRRLPRDDDGRALDQRHPGAATIVRAARARGAARPQHEPLPPPARTRPRRSSRAFLLDDLEQAILAMGPETVCLVHMEPVQNAGGASRRRPATGRACARSATATTSCSRPTR